ncbi:MAG: hypothetical protein KBG15_07890 [Kofleriaceae bacterium]|nr:hypothetical protein [Kofleriaceae bacterium]
MNSDVNLQAATTPHEVWQRLEAYITTAKPLDMINASTHPPCITLELHH